MKHRIARVAKLDLTALRWVIGWCALWLSYGFLCLSTRGQDYDMLRELRPAFVWGALFAVYGAVGLLDCLFRMNWIVARGAGLLGMWLWSYLFLSLAVFDEKPTTAAEIMLVVPIICEVWLLIMAIFFRTKEQRRKLNA